MADTAIIGGYKTTGYIHHIKDFGVWCFCPRPMEARVFRRLFSLIAIASLSGCGGAKTDYSGAYVGGDETALIQLHIVEAEPGRITGNLAVSQLDYGAGKVKLTTRPLTGVRNGQQFSLLAHKKDWSQSDAQLQLEAKGNSLVLMIPGTGKSLEMKPMGQEEYRERLTQFAQALNANDVGLLPDE